MSGIPKEIPNFGSVALTPRQNPEFTPGADFSSEDYYVWTRCDGRASAKEIILMIGLGFDRGAAILDKLRRSGAILLGDETPKSVAPAAEPPPDAGEQPDGSGDTLDLGELTEEEQGALAEDVALTDDEKRRIIATRRKIANADYFEVLGVARDAGKRDLKRAYFRLSKEFHPDRHYGQSLGTFAGWLSKIFETATKAFETLNDRRLRGTYEARLRGEAPDRGRPKAQTREEHAADLFQQACDLEVHGDDEDAVRLFAAACRLAPKPRYLSRAALCAKAAGKLSEAEEYAKKAADLRPDDPSCLRVVADVLRAAQRFEEAEDTLIRALEIDTENDKLLAELRSDLAAVRRAVGHKRT